MRTYFSAFRYLYRFIKPFKRYFIFLIAFTFLFAGLNVLQAKATESLINMTIDGQMTLLIILLFAGLVLANFILTYVNGRVSTLLGAKVNKRMKNHISDIIVDAEYHHITEVKTGDILSTLNNDTNIITGFISGNMISLFSQFVVAVVVFVYVISINPLLCLITFIYTPLGILFTFKINNKMRNIYKENADYKADSLSIFEQFLSSIPVVKSFIIEKKAVEHIQKAQQQLFKSNMELSKYNAMLQAACSAVNSFPRICFLIFGASMVFQGEISVGLLVAVFDLLNYIIGPSTFLPFLISNLNRSIASINRIRRLEEIPKAKRLEGDFQESSQPYVQGSNVSFQYTEGKPILNQVSFSFNTNGVYVIMGESGRGKTTLMDLIAGLYKPDSGFLKVCGLDPSKQDVGHLISVVSQDIYLFRASVAENIHLAKPELPTEDMMQIIRSYEFLNFVHDLPEGFNTMLGDGNKELSGGQRQRIALAQVMLKDSPVWLMDEPVSAIDSETKKMIFAIIQERSKDHLIIVCAHDHVIEGISAQTIHLGGITECI